MKASSLLAFITGAAIGAAAVYLTCTDKGRQQFKKGLDFIEKKVAQETAEQEAENE